MSRVKIARRITLSMAVLVVVAIVVATVVGVSLVRRSLPQTAGQLAVAGLTSPVTVLRDDRGIPQIYADNAQDLFRAQGFVAAQDRFFEMDLRRHITAGRLSELVGKDGVATDKVVRTMGWRQVAEAELPTLAPATRQYLQAYADGVNAYIAKAGSPDRMALEYSVLGQKLPGYRVEPWSPVDSLAWLKAMAWDLHGDYDNELTRARLSGNVTPARFAQIFPPYPIDTHHPILSEQAWRPGAATSTRSAASAMPVGLNDKAVRTVYADVAKVLDELPVMVGRGDGIGSNAWVVGPKRSSTGKPLLANDPHLGVGIPGIWYQTGLHCRTVSAACPFDVTGFSFAGMPGIVIGHNQSISWGFTNLDPDVSDFYLEQVRGGSYRRGNSYLPLKQHTETIKVAGGSDLTITVRETVHGPLLSDVTKSVADAGKAALVEGKPEPATYDVSLAWTGLLPGHTADAIFKFNTAQNFSEFRAAARDFAVPAQNLLYADTQGHIGYQAPGQVPIRRTSTPGAPPGYWPAPGWDPAYDWTGFVPFEQMPTAYDPPEGYIVSANQAVTASQTPFLTTEWDYGFRSERIRNLITATPTVTPQRMSQIQGDTRNEFAPKLVKALLEVNVDSDPAGKDPFTKEGQNLLRKWDFTQPSGRSSAGAAAAFYNAVWNNILELTFNDELGAMKADGGSRWMQAMSGLLDAPRDPWWDNRLTAGVSEGRDEILRQAMVQARKDLTEQLGKDPVTWQWGRLHQLTLTHTILGGDSVPAPVRAVFNRGPWQMGGGSSIVNANGWDASKGYDVDWAPSMRMIVDLGDLDASRWVTQTGSSGHPYDAHYVDQADAWVRNETYPWPFSAKAVRDGSGDELTLTPGASGG